MQPVLKSVEKILGAHHDPRKMQAYTATEILCLQKTETRSLYLKKNGEEARRELNKERKSK